jgi:hypothetical protein
MRIENYKCDLCGIEWIPANQDEMPQPVEMSISGYRDPENGEWVEGITRAYRDVCVSCRKNIMDAVKSFRVKNG